MEHSTPYIRFNLYPPLTAVLFAPLVDIPFRVAYWLIALTTLGCYVFITLAFPMRVIKEPRTLPVLMLIFITGLFSYGLQFEIERGQFNVIAVACCFAAIWICHFRRKYRYFAYCLFSLSVQLKVFPLIFIVMLIRDWRDWKGNVALCLALSAANFALLFVLGPTVFFDFLEAIARQMAHPDIWRGNHSIRTAVSLLGKYAPQTGWPSVRNGRSADCWPFAAFPCSSSSCARFAKTGVASTRTSSSPAPSVPC